MRQTLVIARGITKQGRRDGHGFGVCEQGVIGVEMDGRRGQGKGGITRLGRLVEFLLRFDHLGRVSRERGEVGVHGDDGSAKTDVGVYHKESGEEPEGRGRGEEEEDGGGSAQMCEGEEQWVRRWCTCLLSARLALAINLRRSTMLPVEMTASACRATDIE